MKTTQLQGLLCSQRSGSGRGVGLRFGKRKNVFQWSQRISLSSIPLTKRTAEGIFVYKWFTRHFWLQRILYFTCTPGGLNLLTSSFVFACLFSYTAPITLSSFVEASYRRDIEGRTMNDDFHELLSHRSRGQWSCNQCRTMVHCCCRVCR